MRNLFEKVAAGICRKAIAVIAAAGAVTLFYPNPVQAQPPSDIGTVDDLLGTQAIVSGIGGVGGQSGTPFVGGELEFTFPVAKKTSIKIRGTLQKSLTQPTN